MVLTRTSALSNLAKAAEAHFRPLVLILLIIMGAVQVLSIRQESQTWDEGFDLAAGYSYWKTGDFRINREHPPLGKFINALPLLLLQPKLPLGHPSWAATDNPEFGSEFLYKNSIPADTLLFTGRMMTILLTLTLGLALALWTRRQFNAPAAIVALLFFCFDPNLIAHGRYVTSDLFVTLFSFLACISWGAFLTGGRKPALLWAGITLGLAITSKFSAFFLLPVYLLLYLVRWWQQRGRFGLRRLALSLALVTGVAFLVMVAVYAPEARRLLPVTRKAHAAQPAIRMLYDVVDQSTATGKAIAWTGRQLGWQAHSFFVAVAMIAAHDAMGHEAYLLGMHSNHGWWYYFPVAFAVKTPSATLLALALLLLLAARSLWSSSLRALLVRLRAARFAWFILLVPILFYFSASMAGSINIGLRHILPVYPFLFALLGAGLCESRWRYQGPALALIALGLIAESLAIYPHYLAFFNTLAGGSGNGPRYLVDSNIDWGQDAKKIKAYMTANYIPSVCLCYFGRAEFWYYGIDYQGLPATQDLRQRAELDCVAAISVTPLYGVYVPPERFAWLRELKPMEKIGYSIYLYDLRKKPAGRNADGAR